MEPASAGPPRTHGPEVTPSLTASPILDVTTGAPDILSTDLLEMLPTEVAQDVGQAYDALADGYDGFHIDAKSRAENSFIAERLAGRIDAGSRVLDLGCGTGLLLDLLPISPDRYLGVDVSQGMLSSARQKHPSHRFVLGDAQRLDATLGPFDMVVSLFGAPSYCSLEGLSGSVNRLRADAGGLFLMYCGPRYVRRSTYINKSVSLLQSYSATVLKSTYPDSRVWGMSWVVDVAPRRTPVPIMRRLLSFDAHTVGRLMPDVCFFIIVER